MSDTISRQEATDALRKMQTYKMFEGDDVLLIDQAGAMTELMLLPPAQPEIIRCKDCKYWVPGYITDNDDFIPPKCGEWQQMVGHSSDDYCSLAKRREDE